MSFFSKLVPNIIGLLNKTMNGFEASVIGIDLGTANTLMCVRNKGVVLNEPSIVAYITENGMTIPYLFGRKAKNMYGKTPIKMNVVAPLEDGVISDFRMGEEMIKHFVHKILGRYTLHRPTAIVGVPLNATPVEKRSIQDSVSSSGTKDTFLVYESMAAAIGAKLPIDQPHGSMIVDIGGGTTEVSLVSLGGIVKGKSVRLGGNRMDEKIMNYIRDKYSLLIGKTTSENIKCEIGVAQKKDTKNPMKMIIRGRDLKLGIPVELEITEDDVAEALRDIIKEVVETIRETLESAPPELASDIVDRGIILCGGGAMLRGLDEVIANAVNLPVFVPFNPHLCTINGLSKMVKNYTEYDYILFKEV